MDQLKSSTMIHGDMPARSLVEVVEGLVLRAAQVERDPNELCECAERNATGDLAYTVREIRAHLDLDR